MIVPWTAETNLFTMKQKRHFVSLLRVFVITFIFSSPLLAQSQAGKKKILLDVAHGQKFYNDPNDMAGKDPAFVERIKYMTGELSKNAASNNAEVSFQKSPINAAALSNIDLLFIHMPSAKFTADEVKAITDYLSKGGSLFIVMEVDYWATLEQSNVNDIVTSFGITFKTDNPDGQSSGGYSKETKVTKKKFSIPYHGARMVEGGTPFAFSNKTEENPFGIFKEVGKGGKVVAMGDGMVSLYMTSWEGVSNYQCSEFMNDVLGWLLK
jgi:hypothetical protein